MEVALPLLGGFAVGLAVRDLLRRSFATAFRLNLAVGVALVGLLAGWSFREGAADIAALGALLAAQLTAVLLAARLFRGHRDGPLLAFTPYGNPGFWTVPVAAATLGSRAAVVIATYDLVTQPRLAVALRLMRRRAPVRQRGRSALADYAPAAAATTGLIAGRIHPAPAVVPHVVAALATVMAAVGALLIGAAWPRRPSFGRRELALTARALTLHLSFVPAVLALAALAGLPVPPAAWLLVLGPMPISTLPFARLYGYSTRLAACTITVSLVVAIALLPLALAIARSG